jgi:hypothetical protein
MHEKKAKIKIELNLIFMQSGWNYKFLLEVTKNLDYETDIFTHYPFRNYTQIITIYHEHLLI